MSVTQKQIATRLGISNQLVSYALNGNGTVSEAMRQRIVMTAQEMGYQPNGIARAMKSGRFGCVALLLSTRPNHSTLPAAVLEGIHDELACRDYHLSLFRLPDQELTNAEKMPKILREWMADGLIVDYTHGIPPKLIELVELNRLPAVWFNALQEFDCVRPDDYGASRELTRRLIEMGHKRVLYSDHSPHLAPSIEGEMHYSLFDRLSGYHDEMESHGLKPTTCLGTFPFLAGKGRGPYVERLREAMKCELPTAIISIGGYSLQAAYLIAGEMGLQVPEQLSIASFANQTRLEYATVEQTVMAQQEVAMGTELVRMLSEKIESSSYKIATRVIPFQFVPGTTVAPLV